MTRVNRTRSYSTIWMLAQQIGLLRSDLMLRLVLILTIDSRREKPFDLHSAVRWRRFGWRALFSVRLLCSRNFGAGSVRGCHRKHLDSTDINISGDTQIVLLHRYPYPVTQPARRYDYHATSRIETVFQFGVAIAHDADLLFAVLEPVVTRDKGAPLGIGIAKLLIVIIMIEPACSFATISLRVRPSLRNTSRRARCVLKSKHCRSHCQ